MSSSNTSSNWHTFVGVMTVLCKPASRQEVITLIGRTRCYLACAYTSAAAARSTTISSDCTYITHVKWWGGGCMEDNIWLWELDVQRLLVLQYTHYTVGGSLRGYIRQQLNFTSSHHNHCHSVLVTAHRRRPVSNISPYGLLHTPDISPPRGIDNTEKTVCKITHKLDVVAS